MRMNGTRRLIPTLWDRLQDDAPHQGEAAEEQRFVSLDEYKRTIVRDLEILVNTRSELLGGRLNDFPGLRGTVLGFGLPDFLGRGLHSSEDRRLIQRQLEYAIESNDRRFRNVQVKLLDQDGQDRLLRFRVETLLVLKDATRQVAFDAVLHADTQQYKVQNLS
ncbi:type VI secretion system baseplate subunit TssE [Cobetia marina]|jgi:type VI secretion system protein ImpF|uniref:type VI secretion system baseplate subunit TssE n=1 Tax=Cobetia TaxID=204286 RepID=UPI0011739619|nr:MULTISPECIES: type VI secretion system baseplate subunit TssE [Cobetia]MDH2375421.1 type VI secretion system baseplate subunit TssE [Cobetia sp. 3AK]MDN2658108.1 type VI secretion system baseplate subunit TssE [Cobetia sp. 14N.309.X.WAT.E.A4]MDO6788232.1 type VI secretion system baseplate subunit TssE [Cobetia marina]GED43555.1 type VI secretion protein [Cobetia marina]